MYLRFTKMMPSLLMLFSSALWLSCSSPATTDPTPTSSFTGRFSGKMVLTITSPQRVLTQTWDPATVTIKAGSKADEVQLIVGTTFGDYNEPWTATTRGTTLTLPRQQATGDPYAFEGTGTLAGNQLTMTVQQTQPGVTTSDTYQYQITATRQ